MDTNTLRQKYLDFFAKRAHKIIPSSPLIPADDPTLLFTCAGMNQFKNEFLGRVTDFRRAVTCQRCLRTDDLDKVGSTDYHHTFFEMLGNFSFGSYFKEEAVLWAWEFLTRELKLSPNDLWVSVYLEDTEAFNIWRDKIAIPVKKIVKLGAKDNFWPANAIIDGPNGPCGPCSEIFFDYGPEAGCKEKNCQPGCNCGRFVEIWNLVFTQFNRKDNGILEPLPNKNIDTGMGLERIASVMQGVKSNFEIDIFQPIIKEISRRQLAGAPARQIINTIADHIRAIVFAIYDGVIPSNEQRGYVVRKLIRKSEFHANTLGIKEPFLHTLVTLTAKTFKTLYPDLSDKSEYISNIILAEEKLFGSTLNNAPRILEAEFKNTQTRTSNSGRIAFKLHDTYGIPLEITRNWAKEHGFEINQQEFELCLKEQQERSQKSSKISKNVFAEEALDFKVKETKFMGYNRLKLKEAKVLKIIRDGKFVKAILPGEPAQLVLDKTTFYGESGGQAGDRGKIVKGKHIFQVEDTRKLGRFFLHFGKIDSGRIKTGDTVSPEVDTELRQASSRAHTATHILQASLREVLGAHIRQAGSLVSPDRLRFDFIHPDKLSAADLNQIENLVEKNILAGHGVGIKETGIKQAMISGALAFFGDKYESKVRVVNIGSYSQELCAGTHLNNSSQVGLFIIISEGSIAKGIRRIEALTGGAAWKRLKQDQAQLIQIADTLKSNNDQICSVIEDKLKKLESLEKENNRLKLELFNQDIDALIAAAEVIGNTKLISRKYQNIDINGLRSIIDLIKSKLSSYAVCLGSQEGEKAWLLAAFSEDLLPRNCDASIIIKGLSPLIQGNGGGKRNMAQAGGRDIQKIDSCLDRFKEIVRGNLTQ